MREGLLNEYAFVFIVLLTAFMVFVYIPYRKYKCSLYRAETGNSFLKVFFDKGLWGEYLTASRIEKGFPGVRLLMNTYLPNGDTTSEVDLIAVHSDFLVVVESKNYGGWIFGDETGKTWTQCLPSGRKSRKEHFYNPILQNATHVKCLERYLGELLVDQPLLRVVVFSDRCQFRRLNVTSSVIHRKKICRTIHKWSDGGVARIGEERAAAIYEKLKPLTMVSEEVKKKHIADIRKRRR